MSDRLTTDSLGVLQCLSKASEQLLSPPKMAPNDRLRLWSSEDGLKLYAQVYHILRGEERLGGSRAATRIWVERVPEAKYEARHLRWSLAATDFTVLVIHHCWPSDQISFQDEQTERIYQYLLLRFLHQNKGMRARAVWKQTKVLPELPEDYREPSQYPLSDYQQLGVYSALDQEGFSFFVDRGLGKTIMSITVCCIEALRTLKGRYGPPHVMKVLIVCPRQVRINWQQELDRFATVPCQSVVLRGGASHRSHQVFEAMRHDGKSLIQIVITSYEGLQGTLDVLKGVTWDRIIFDESHYTKSQGTKRSKSSRAIRDFGHRVLILTGSPLPNSVMDLWAQLELLSDGMSGFLKFPAFRKFFGKFKKVEVGDGKSVDSLTGLKNIPLIQERLARVAYVLSKKDSGIELPEKVYDAYEVMMTPEQRRVYIQLVEQLAVRFESQDLSDSLVAENVLTQMLRLAQITSGHVKLEESGVHQISGSNPKVDALMEIINEEPVESKLIVWNIFREDARVICGRLEAEGIQYRRYDGSVKDEHRQEAVDAFNKDPEVKVFVANPTAAAEGLNLIGYDRDNADSSPTFTGRVVFFSQSWNAVHRAQAEDRAHRRGARETVRITDLVVPGTIDEEIRQRVRHKQEVSGLIQDLSGLFKRVLNTEFLDD